MASLTSPASSGLGTGYQIVGESPGLTENDRKEIRRHLDLTGSFSPKIKFRASYKVFPLEGGRFVAGKIVNAQRFLSELRPNTLAAHGLIFRQNDFESFEGRAPWASALHPWPLPDGLPTKELGPVSISPGQTFEQDRTNPVSDYFASEDRLARCLSLLYESKRVVLPIGDDDAVPTYLVERLAELLPPRMRNALTFSTFEVNDSLRYRLTFAPSRCVSDFLASDAIVLSPTDTSVKSNTVASPGGLKIASWAFRADWEAVRAFYDWSSNLTKDVPSSQATMDRLAVYWDACQERQKSPDSKLALELDRAEKAAGIAPVLAAKHLEEAGKSIPHVQNPEASGRLLVRIDKLTQLPELSDFWRMLSQGLLQEYEEGLDIDAVRMLADVLGSETTASRKLATLHKHLLAELLDWLESFRRDEPDRWLQSAWPVFSRTNWARLDATLRNRYIDTLIDTLSHVQERDQCLREMISFAENSPVAGLGDYMAEHICKQIDTMAMSKAISPEKWIDDRCLVHKIMDERSPGRLPAPAAATALPNTAKLPTGAVHDQPQEQDIRPFCRKDITSILEVAQKLGLPPAEVVDSLDQLHNESAQPGAAPEFLRALTATLNDESSSAGSMDPLGRLYTEELASDIIDLCEWGASDPNRQISPAEVVSAVKTLAGLTAGNHLLPRRLYRLWCRYMLTETVLSRGVASIDPDTIIDVADTLVSEYSLPPPDIEPLLARLRDAETYPFPPLRNETVARLFRLLGALQENAAASRQPPSYFAKDNAAADYSYPIRATHGARPAVPWRRLRTDISGAVLPARKGLASKLFSVLDRIEGNGSWGNALKQFQELGNLLKK